MSKPSRLLLAKDDILALFSATQPAVYTKAQLTTLLAQNRRGCHLSDSTTASDFIAFLTKYGSLRSRTLRAHKYGQEIVRYCWAAPSSYQLALSLRSHSYLSHGTALGLHGLIPLDRKTLYLNIEQSPKSSSGSALNQSAISRAFSNKQRQSQLAYTHGKVSIVQLSGKNTKRLGVEPLSGPSSEVLSVTNLERSLIDAVVRPAYAGGPAQVLAAYRAAKDRVSIERMLAMLKKLDHAYPYHQTIGFMLERGGYPETAYGAFRALGIKYDFYLTHGMHKPAFDAQWRLFYPTDQRTISGPPEDQRKNG